MGIIKTIYQNKNSIVIIWKINESLSVLQNMIKEKSKEAKPKDKNDAFNMLSKLSDNTHKVITGVCIKTQDKELVFSSTTLVTFKKLSEQEINFYITSYNPFDKAGSYGIQDWIGKVGIITIKGSYTNVVGLPLTELYENLKKLGVSPGESLKKSKNIKKLLSILREI